MEQNDISEERPHCMVLRTEGLVKRYGKRTVVNDVSINVRQGEIVGLLGPNGAGKTTSFYMTTGLIVPNAGHIFLDSMTSPTIPYISVPAPASATSRRRRAYSASSAWRTTSCPYWR